jgi:hypothetical protein
LRPGRLRPQGRGRPDPALTSYEALAQCELRLDADLEHFPLARIEAGRPLPLKEGANPAWFRNLTAFKTLVVAPLYGDVDTLTQSQWEKIKTILEPHEAWLAAKAGGEVESIGVERLWELLGDGSRQDWKRLSPRI